jgi:transcriptional regulator with XRE-family HTH domain
LKNVKSKLDVDGYIGSRIRECRLSLSLTQEELADALGISFQQVQNYEKGTNGVSAVQLFDICKILDVSPVTMFPPRPLRGVEAMHTAMGKKSPGPCRGFEFTEKN